MYTSSDARDFPAAPPRTYWRGKTLWANLQVAGRQYRKSLHTSDPATAALRVEELRAALPRDEQILLTRFRAYCTKGEWFLREGLLDRWISEGFPSALDG
jgi:hypothetical protein